MMKKLVVLALLVLAAGCSQQAEIVGSDTMSDFSRISAEQWQALSRRTIYFGHQSVGNNIIEGLREIAAANAQIKLRIVSGEPARAPGVLNASGRRRAAERLLITLATLPASAGAPRQRSQQ